VLRITVPLIAFAIILAGAGCTPAPTGNNSNTNNANTTANANTAAPPPAARTSSSASSSNLALTLPVLDAFFADQAFASDLKSRLQLTDEQVDKLKNIAREAKAKLREGDDHQGTTSAAREQASQQIKAAIGEEKAQQLTAFINERWSGTPAAQASALPTTPGQVPSDTRIVVNTPAFRMDLFDKGQLVKSYRVAIGYPEFPLPTGLRKADTIIFNPSWTPPDEPWVEAGNSKVKVGEKVEPGSKLNPLGPVKIPIGLPSLIHGGKSPAKLGNFGSHGCVGLTSPQALEFSKLLAQVGGAQVSDTQIADYQKNKTETKTVKLANPIPVELRYETISVEDGKLHIYRDVYDHNTNTEETLRSVLQANGVTLEQLSDAERAQVMSALKEMSRDASGKLDAEQPAASSNKNKTAAKPSNSNPNVTRIIKGQKEVVIEIAALKGKGYPAPVGFDAGGAKPAATAKKPAAKKAR
jgi:lipoprotein-anchoring transpeptidase ErfK/SrfK